MFKVQFRKYGRVLTHFTEHVRFDAEMFYIKVGPDRYDGYYLEGVTELEVTSA